MALGLALPEHVVAELLRLGAHLRQRLELVGEGGVGMRALVLLEGAPVRDDHVMLLGGARGVERPLLGDEPGWPIPPI